MEDDLRRAAELLDRSKNVVVVTGAGICTALGIPDFRSRDGIYARIAEEASRKRRRLSQAGETLPPAAGGVKLDHGATKMKEEGEGDEQRGSSAGDVCLAGSGPNMPHAPSPHAISESTPPSSRSRRAAAQAGESKRRRLATDALEAEDDDDAWDHKRVMDIHAFRADPTRFYQFAWLLFPSTALSGGESESHGDDRQGSVRPGPVHRWIRSLDLEGKLLRNYTQNIDGLEVQAGLVPEPAAAAAAAAAAAENDEPSTGKVIFCHGSFATASCLDCGWQVEGRAIAREVRERRVPRCGRCAPGDGKARRGKKGQGQGQMLRGVIKPDITFFNESVPDVFARAWERDREVCDLLIVVGTSLRVSPVNSIPKQLAGIPQILINRESLGSRMRPTVFLQGECDDVIQRLAKVAADLEEAKSGVIDSVPRLAGARP